ncbi:MAG: phosphoglycolate phosphatase [Proteobacteria bacterium]|nr:phosphoglycolate phosphatase [Pseudomonadota bacterium]
MTAVAHPTAGRWRPVPLRAVLFDLDGTLLDTAGDIALALNRSLIATGRSAVAADAVRGWVGQGAEVLVQRALRSFGAKATPVDVAALLSAFLLHYAHLQQAGESTATPYPGAEFALRTLRSGRLRVAVVTNKPYALATAALECAGLARLIDAVVGGDTCQQRKPDPGPLDHACWLLGVRASEAVMVGDSLNDVTAARAAGMPVVCVPHGYREGLSAAELPCDRLVTGLEELPEALLGPLAAAWAAR